jgi:hypothetical protein
MTSKETVSRRGASPRERFIPVRKTDLLNTLNRPRRARRRRDRQIRRVARLPGAI